MFRTEAGFNLPQIFLEYSCHLIQTIARLRPLNDKEDYDEYKDFYHKFMGLNSSKGKTMMINNYKSVIHALVGIKVSGEEN
jgi:hypothetical protein